MQLPPSLATSFNPPAALPSIPLDSLCMALYSLFDLSAAQLVAWEDATTSYFKEFYNDGSSAGGNAICDAISDVKTQCNVTALNLASGRRNRRKKGLLRASSEVKYERALSSDLAYLLTCTQTTQILLL